MQHNSRNISNLNLELFDTITNTNIDDRDVINAISIDIEKAEKAIKKYRFSKMLEEFVAESPNPVEFYLQNKKEIQNDNDKRIIFLKKFLIKNEEEFYLKVKGLNAYPDEFYDELLRREIIEEQKYICGLCDRDLRFIIAHLHHIDYNKKKCSKDNLIFLCPRCHGKTGQNRQFWQKLLEERKYVKNQ